MKTVALQNTSVPSAVLRLKFCDQFWSKFKGLMFAPELNTDEGIVIVEDRPSRLNTAIHMFFMRFDLAVVWLDEEGIVVDKVLAKKWAPIYIPRKAAKYVLELHPARLSDFSPGDQCSFSEQ